MRKLAFAFTTFLLKAAAAMMGVSDDADRKEVLVRDGRGEW